MSYYEILRSEFPAAAIYASTLEDYIENILPIKDQLPVITHEIGDTWIQGISSDPYKLAFQRAFQTGLQLCYDSSRFISKYLYKRKYDTKKPRQYTSYFSFFGYYWGLSMRRDWQALKSCRNGTTWEHNTGSCCLSNKRWRISREQSKIDNPEKLAT